VKRRRWIALYTSVSRRVKFIGIPAGPRAARRGAYSGDEVRRTSRKSWLRVDPKGARRAPAFVHSVEPRPGCKNGSVKRGHRHVHATVEVRTRSSHGLTSWPESHPESTARSLKSRSTSERGEMRANRPCFVPIEGRDVAEAGDSFADYEGLVGEIRWGRESARRPDGSRSRVTPGRTRGGRLWGSVGGEKYEARVGVSLRNDIGWRICAGNSEARSGVKVNGLKKKNGEVPAMDGRVRAGPGEGTQRTSRTARQVRLRDGRQAREWTGPGDQGRRRVLNALAEKNPIEGPAAEVERHYVGLRSAAKALLEGYCAADHRKAPAGLTVDAARQRGGCASGAARQ